MNLALLALAGTAFVGTYFGFKKKDPSMNLSNCFFDKLANPIYNLFNDWHSNSLFLIDKIGDDCVSTNTPFKELYAVKLVTNQTIKTYLSSDKIDEIIRDYKESNDAFIFYLLHKQGNYQKQYILTHNKVIAKVIADYYDTQLLNGIEIVNLLYNAYLQNSFFINDKQLHQSLYINKDDELSEPEFLQFKRLAKQAIRKNYQDISMFQAYKHLNINETDIASIFKLKFTGTIWIYIDFSKNHIENHISRLISYSKMLGNKAPFIELQNAYKNKELDCAVINAMAFLKEYDDEVIGSLGSYLKTSFIKKEIYRSNHFQKNLIKFRDSEFDFLVKSNYLHNYIASIHKHNTSKPDIFGTDKNGSFLNYSFSAENDNPHSVIIAKPGSGKSVSKQKIMAQMVGLNFADGSCSNLGKNPNNVRIRSYDIGFSDEKFMKLISSNPNNSTAIIDSSLAKFSYNIVNIPNIDDRELFEADMQFNIDLCSIILETQNASPLTIEESAFLKSIFRELYSNKEYTKYRVMNLEEQNKELYDELISLNYKTDTFLQDIGESKYNFLKVPLLNDFVKKAEQRSKSKQLKVDEQAAYASLATKLNSIEMLGLFSDFDKINIDDVDVLNMDLNNFKESTLFTAIFLSIFQKTYLKDREYALECKRAGRPAPKLFYAVEEAKNYFRNNKTFEEMFDKVTLEARKYNVHLCFIVQNADHIPWGILKNIDTRIFLLRPDKKNEVIGEIRNIFGDNSMLPKNLEIALLETKKYEMCVWYSSGVFNMKFDITPDEMAVFSTNPNE
ncbi:hypothetical protein LMG7974_01573 [Campylobacter majalis]|uniref:ATP-binding protein n=1 Tax=Campylobacter majalis TaxID=2790656 RepID=A0ABN7KBS0_9BACT|nr:hypothetical protein [Campylobacter majalis]CAD7289496.1 hypothetical protein LMG7974_01573 [Campylobacter majalis]